MLAFALRPQPLFAADPTALTLFPLRGAITIPLAAVREISHGSQLFGISSHLITLYLDPRFQHDGSPLPELHRIATSYISKADRRRLLDFLQTHTGIVPRLANQ